jgi:hypothetical protein
MALSEVEVECNIRAKATATIENTTRTAVGQQLDAPTLTDGTTANCANICLKDYAHAITSGANVDVTFSDLSGFADGDAMDIVGVNNDDFAEVVAIQIKNDDASAGNLEVGAAAANPWLAFLKDATDKIVLKPGACVQFQCAKDPAFAVSAGSKVLRMTAPSGNVTYHMTILARSV